MLGRSFFAFFVVGVLATAVHFLVGLGLVNATRMTPFSANIFAFLSAFLVSYFGHSRFTYKSTAPASRSLPRFFAVASGGLFLNQAIVYLAVDVLGWQYITALVIVVSTVPVIIYFLGRVWAFRE